MIIIFSLTFLAAKPVWSCSCEKRYLHELYEKADYLFTGKVMHVSGGYVQRVTFKIEDIFKGYDQGHEMSLLTTQPCIFTFVEGADYIVFAYAGNEGYVTGLCSGNRDKTAETLQQLKEAITAYRDGGVYRETVSASHYFEIPVANGKTDGDVIEYLNGKKFRTETWKNGVPVDKGK